MPSVRQVKSLHELLLEQGLLGREQLQALQAQAEKAGIPFKRMLVQQGLIAEDDLTNLLAAQLGVTVLNLSSYLIKPEIIQLVPEALARKHTLIPVFKIGEALTVAVEDPLNFFALDEVRLKTKCEIKAVIASASAIRQAIDQSYGTSASQQEVARAIEAAQLPAAEATATNDAPVVRLVNLLIAQAAKEGASDIHLEPGEATFRTRFRIDGLLHEVTGPPKHLHAAVVSRVKVLANVDISETRKPQDGRFRLKMDDKDLDIRVSTIPTCYGEKVVMRLLDSSAVRFGLEQLGFGPEMLERFQRIIRSPYGILLVTGPTGSGKTTTLYAALYAINTEARNIVTIEDPIEYQLAGVNQVQVNPKAEVTFASALRAFLRQDPNVIMVGEIRDRETAEIAIQAALTGHQVFSTLHTNDAPGALARLADMGIEPFLTVSAVIGVMGQRLVRLVCQKCKTADHPPERLLEQLGLSGCSSLVRGAGCEACKQTGYKGRAGIFELLLMTDAIRQRLSERSSTHQIRQIARREGMGTIREDGAAKAAAGLTTIEEVLRVTQLDEKG
ncbi:MAG: Flp pilus assembly complex ATPase component TadA [Candidatus Omnitrophica bacterium]|nr:Flp pilus assembly complex ATPase component TadA [Candidatus Omnitrophota bacterium]